MAKHIRLKNNDNSREYHLEFTAGSIKRVFEAGLTESLDKNPIEMCEILFWAALLKEDKTITRKQSTKILRDITGFNGRYAFDNLATELVNLFIITKEAIQAPEGREDIAIEGDDPKNVITED